MRYLFLLLIVVPIILNAQGKKPSDPDYDATDWYFDSIYAVQTARYLAIKDSVALDGLYERLDQAIKHPETVTELEITGSSIKILRSVS